MLAIGPAATALQPGDHGTTFGGNPVVCAAALAVLDTVERDGLLRPPAGSAGGSGAASRRSATRWSARCAGSGCGSASC